MRWHSLALLLVALTACEEDAAPSATLDDPPTSRPDTPDAGVDPEPEPAATGRAVGRLTVEQLTRSIPVITGGVEWIEDFGQGPVNLLEVFGPTLGAPDYLRITEENTEPTLLIAKFMQDASHAICVDWVAKDAAAPADERTLVAHADWSSTDEALVKENLRRLQLRFYSRFVPPEEETAIADLFDLFVNASSTAPAQRAAEDGWLAVCIAMMTDPEFILY